MTAANGTSFLMPEMKRSGYFVTIVEKNIIPSKFPNTIHAKTISVPGNAISVIKFSAAVRQPTKIGNDMAAWEEPQLWLNMD